MLNTPFSPWPSFSEDEVEAVSRVLRSNRVNSWTGEECKLFEREFADWAGSTYAIAVGNGTLALDLALRGLDIGPGDEVVVTPRTFLASVSCVVNAGAVPVFADIDPDSGNITADTIAAVLSERTRAVILVHLAGWPCDMDPIMALAERHGLKVIEDCAQAHGARYNHRPVGSIGHVGAWSFCQDKIISTGGEGGMVTTDDEAVWSRMWSFKDHGKSWQAVFEREHPPGFRWLHESFGTNWRLTEMQAAIGRVQLRKVTDWSAARERNAVAIHSALAAFADARGPLRAPALSDDARRSNGSRHAYYRLYAYVRPKNLAPGWTRDRIVNEIVARGVPCYQGSCSEVYLEKAFEDTPWRPRERLPVARELGDTSLMFLVHPTLTEAEIAKTADTIRAVVQQASTT